MPCLFTMAYGFHIIIKVNDFKFKLNDFFRAHSHKICWEPFSQTVRYTCLLQYIGTIKKNNFVFLASKMKLQILVLCRSLGVITN